MNRRNWLACLGIAGLQGVGLVAARVRGDEPISLQSTLEKALFCRRPEEFEFVALVAQKVDEGKLPRAIVLAMLKWARERRHDFPFPYFQAGMREHAKRLNVQL